MRNNHEEKEQTIDDAIHRLVRNLRRRSPSTPRGSHGYIRLLSLINEHDGASSSELAALMDIRPSSLTEMLGYLESDGMIHRNRDEKDLRVVRVFIENIGREHIKQSKSIVEDHYLDILTPEECKVFIELCNKLSTGLRNRIPFDSDCNDKSHSSDCDQRHHHHSERGFHKDFRNKDE